MINKNKRSFWRTISLTLILCLVITSIPAMAFADSQNDENMAEKVFVQDEGIVTDNLTEESVLLEESGLDYTTFDLGGDRRTTVFHSTNVRYENEEGELIDYDPTLISLATRMSAQSNIKDFDITSYAYRNKEGDSYQYIPESLSEETPILMKKDEYALTMAPTAKTYKDFFGKTVKVKREKEEVADIYQQKKREIC